jgi:hypothetical protein
MMQIAQEVLIKELLELTEKAIDSARKMKNLPESTLNFKKSPTEWSILECFEHLNLYGDFYLPEIENQMLASPKIDNAMTFRSGIIGNYFANLMKEKNGKIKKMKSPKDKIPATSNLSITTIDRFLKQQERLKSLLIQSKNVDLTKVKTAISLTKLIRLRLGDTFRFVVYHIERHLLQAERAKLK